MLEEFLEKISPKGEIECCKITSEGCYKVSLLDGLSNKENNIYFLGGVSEGLKNRASDHDIKYVSYIRFDIDIKKQAKHEFDVDLDDEGLTDNIDLLKYQLDKLEYFKEYSYLVKSGSGCHIYYCSDPIDISEQFTYIDFKFAMERIYRKFNEVIEYNYLKTDMSCKNIARIMRLPGSINQKTGTECKIMYFQNHKSRLVQLLPKFAAIERKERYEQDLLEQSKRKEDAETNRKMNMLIYGKDESAKMERIFDQINKVPAYLVSEFLMPEFKFAPNGKNFLSGRNGKGNEYKGFYYVSESNSICNGGSECLNWGTESSCWSPSVLVKNYYGYEWKEVIQFFKNNFKINI